MEHVPDHPVLLPRPRCVVLPGRRVSAGGLPRVRVRAPREDLEAFARAAASRFLRDLRAATGHRLAPVGAGGFTLRIGTGSATWSGPGAGPPEDADERYELVVDDGGARLTAPGPWGVPPGLATLRQLAVVGASGLAFHAAAVRDGPRYPWRGLLLDPARRFLPLPDLLRVLDAMECCRLNGLHLHLTDDQGFRFDDPRYLELAAVNGDGAAYDPGTLSELVRAAAERGIRVVPELDQPGHAGAWLAAQPDLALLRPGGSVPTAPRRSFGVSRLAPDPRGGRFVERARALLDAFAAVFPGPFLHLGGDELHPEAWTGEALERAARAEGLRDPDGFRGRLLAPLLRHVAAGGRRAVVWDEALDALPGDAPPTVVEVWRDPRLRDGALARGHDVVMAHGYYLDLAFPAEWHTALAPRADAALLREHEAALGGTPDLQGAGPAWAAYLAWVEAGVRKALAGAASAERDGVGRLLGAEACLWGELVDGGNLESRLWPRLPALADVFWSGAAAPLVPGGIDARLHAFAGQGDALPRPDPLRDLDRALAAAGVPAADRSVWLRLAALLEPLRWYRRHTGDRPPGSSGPRPYDADSPLDTFAARVPPDAPAVRAFALDRLRGRTGTWAGSFRALGRALPSLAPLPAALGLPPGHVAAFAERLEGLAAGLGSGPGAAGAGVPARLYEPVGELRLGPAGVLLRLP